MENQGTAEGEVEKEKERERMELNKDKSVKCYMKALKIDPLSEEAGWGVSEIFLSKEGKIDAQNVCVRDNVW